MSPSLCSCSSISLWLWLYVSLARMPFLSLSLAFILSLLLSPWFRLNVSSSSASILGKHILSHLSLSIIVICLHICFFH